MSAQGERRAAFAETCRLRAAHAFFPFWRKSLLVFAQLSQREATLMERSRDYIDESKKLIARADVLLRR